MTTSFIKTILKNYLATTLILIVALYAYHKLAPLTAIHPLYSFVFVALLSLLIMALLIQVYKQFPEFIGISFLVFITLKMIAVVIYILPHIKGEEIYPKSDLVYFLITIFVYLGLKAFLVTKLLNKK